MGAVDGVIDHMGYDEVVASERRVYRNVGSIFEFLIAAYLLSGGEEIAFKLCVLPLQVLVDSAEVEIGCDVVGRLVDVCSQSVGRSEIYRVLIGVVVEQQDATYHYIDAEKHPGTPFQEE